MLSKQSAVSKPLITEREMCICNIVMETKTTFNPFGLKKRQSAASIVSGAKKSKVHV